jgi:hypothetical protein
MRAMLLEPVKNDNPRWDVPIWVFFIILVVGAITYALQVP